MLERNYVEMSELYINCLETIPLGQIVNMASDPEPLIEALTTRESYTLFHTKVSPLARRMLAIGKKWLLTFKRNGRGRINGTWPRDPVKRISHAQKKRSAQSM